MAARRLAALSADARGHVRDAFRWLSEQQDLLEAEAGARRFALTVGRSLELALLAHHASWCLERDDRRAACAARRLAANGITQLHALPRSEAAELWT